MKQLALSPWRRTWNLEIRQVLNCGQISGRIWKLCGVVLRKGHRENEFGNVVFPFGIGLVQFMGIGLSGRVDIFLFLDICIRSVHRQFSECLYLADTPWRVAFQSVQSLYGLRGEDPLV